MSAESPSMGDEEVESRRPTPSPAFDMESFARSSETELRVATVRSARWPSKEPDADDDPSTAPPPPGHPASILPRVAKGQDAAPESRPRTPAAALRDSLRECTHRAEFLRAMLRVGGLSRTEGARALRAELRALESMAMRAGDRSLSAISHALRLAIEELGGVADEQSSNRTALVWVGSDAGARDTVSVAAETQGFVVRVATSGMKFWAMLMDRKPDLIVVRWDVCGFEPREFCALAREALGEKTAPILMLVPAGSDGAALTEESTGAARCLPIDLSIDGLVAELVELLREDVALDDLMREG